MTAVQTAPVPSPADTVRAWCEARREVEGKATEGPWGTTVEVDGVYAGRATAVSALSRDESRALFRIVTVGQTRPHSHRDAEGNCAFIAASRVDLPAALAALEAVLALCERPSTGIPPSVILSALAGALGGEA